MGSLAIKTSLIFFALIGLSLSDITEECTATTCYCSYLAVSNKILQSDLTFAVDASFAVGNYENFNKVLRWILNYILQDVALSTNSAGIAVQVANSSLTATDFFFHENDACETIKEMFLTSEKQLSDSPSIYKILSRYLQTTKQYGRTGYPQTLVLISSTSNDSIINAMEIVQTVRKSGTQLLIVGVNQTDTSPTNYFYKLTENVKLYSGYDLPSIGLASWIFDLANSTKVSLQKSKPFIREDAPKSVLSAIGTPCSANVFKSDMDVEILVDETISSDDLGDLGTYLADVLSGLHLDGNTINSSCVGIVGYETENLDKILPLKDCAPYDKIFEALINLESSSVDSDGTSNLLNALNTSLTDFLDQKSNQSKHKLLIVAARSYSTTDLSTIISTAEQLKLNDVFIVTLDYSSGSESNTEQKSETKKASTALASASTAALVLFSESPKSYDSAKILLTETDHASNSPSIGEVLATISSEEQVYSKNDTDLVDLLTSALAYTNCQCPKNSTQLSVMDPKTNHKALFADCFYPVMEVSTAYSAEKQCESMGGTLISFTNRLKFDFVQERITKRQLPNVNFYWSGLTFRSTDRSLNWYHYDRLNLPVGQSNNLVPESSKANTTSYCGQVSMNVKSKSGPKIEFTSCNILLPFICQIHAFDADHTIFQ